MTEKKREIFAPFIMSEEIFLTYVCFFLFFVVFFFYEKEREQEEEHFDIIFVNKRLIFQKKN